MLNIRCDAKKMMKLHSQPHGFASGFEERQTAAVINT